MTTNTPEDRFTLNQQDLDSATWARLKKHFAQRIDVLARRLEGDLNDRETANFRGRIAELRALLALDK